MAQHSEDRTVDHIKDTLFLIEKLITYRFIDQQLLVAALTDESFYPLDPNASNRKLALLGDRVLSAIVLQLLYRDYPKQPIAWFPRIQQHVVTNAYLADVAEELGLHNMLVTGPRKYEGRRNNALATGFEALVGAITTDRGYEEALLFLERVYWPRTKPLIPTYLLGRGKEKKNICATVHHICRRAGIDVFWQHVRIRQGDESCWIVALVETRSRKELARATAETREAARRAAAMEAYHYIR